MNTVLLRSCASLWILGLFAMWIARALLALEPTSLPFQIGAGLWILGGLGYTGLALSCCTSSHAAAPPARRTDL
jgi:hypothetical protein